MEREGIKVTLTWRGEGDLGDKSDPLAWRWLVLDEVLAFFEDGKPRSSNFRGKVEMEEKEKERNEMREREVNFIGWGMGFIYIYTSSKALC